MLACVQTGSMSEQFSLLYPQRILCFQTKKNENENKEYQSTIWALMRENLSSGCGNNKGEGADQPRLISAFVIPFLESIIYKLVTSEISFF